ncbi:MAG: TraG family conjugative transposon ATPase, partial [Cyclobacteriaceae bacterium]|nr:TraG family conjugative transposon ATPase [Cyclobacteriaceae bacterium]
LTKNEKRNRFFANDPKGFESFLTKVEKVMAVLETSRCSSHALGEAAIKQLIRQFLTLHFDEIPGSYHNLECTTDHIRQGTGYIKSNTLIDIDQINLPSTLQPTTSMHEPGFPLPVDMMHFLSNISGYQSMVYHQVITIPNQEAILNKLRMKRKRHISIPDPANMLSVKDIDAVLEDIAQNNRILVHAHYNILIKATQKRLSQTTNTIESQLFKLGIIPSANDSNQLELFRTILPGNTGELSSYNQFLTSSDAAICLMYKERFPINEDSTFQIHLTDRKGIPIAIDTNDQPLQQGRINNRNKFVLGPSGSGKSFFMNHLVRQYYEYDMDIVLVDTGHSYEGLCHYYNGQYITYSEDRPITMNPFRITKEEFNEEKREFLKALIGLLWKGADGTLSQIEDTMLSKVIHQYYEAFWQKKISNLGFNSFYELSTMQIAEIAKAENIPFDLETYRFVLKKFYKGGHYEHILNKDMEASLFDAPFIVFEIDAIKEHKILFPITTLIIMDVFLQKMRLKTNRKCLIIEEAWKAIASPMMAGYILYLYKTIRKYRGEAIVVTQE